MKKYFRLTRSTDFKRVRRNGKSYAHPLVILYTITCDSQQARVGVTAGRWVGGAVKRNRAKRLLREAMRILYPQILPGNELILIARNPLSFANLMETESALAGLLHRANLISEPYDINSLSAD